MVALIGEIVYKNIITRVLLKDLCLRVCVGVSEEERLQAQEVMVHIELEIHRLRKEDALRSSVCYESVLKAVLARSRGLKVKLLETLGEKIMEVCFAFEPVCSCLVRLEKVETPYSPVCFCVEVFGRRKSEKEEEEEE